ncbi:hypothetical protein O988_03712 [Pseudogymnoascus sp. VKM F-3808]|nr:hypothetical protein O988_03712 [Pseudogymnoascus sp. VKM F-3808]KFY45125.1 hypothetical protein V495_03111 [Pseudogymnoascus sp. VKM F-4514 (FW-929)]KFY60762.1 hypothetical protein V497_03395 [Pseudogymnoascus sp. VKM F-4516 (FW-969)]
MSDNNTSTIQSYIDSATGAAQSALGSLTGSTADSNAGQAKKDKADFEDAASHATLKGPGFTATADGIAKDDPRRQEGAWNQTVGAGKEAVGGLLGADGLKRAGQEQNAAGKGQEAEGQLNDLGGGIAGRVSGAVGGAVAGLTGDREAQLEAQKKHDEGKAQQRGAEHDIQKQNQ